MRQSISEISLDVVDTILENAYEWIVVVDHKGFITYMNKNYCEFVEVSQEEVVGKHVTEVIENTRMHIVAETGKEELAELQYIRGSYMIANRIPIFSNGKSIGAFGTVIFRDTSHWMQMSSHVKDLMSKIQSYIQDINSGAKYTLNDILTNSPKVLELKEKVKLVAASDISILIRGESGTGKELFAHSIHQLSNRSPQPFIKLNCAAIPEHLLESELFGYEEGAFTGAKKGGKKGKFQLADGGTLFLDEIGDMPMNMQVKLLRALQEGEIEPVGSTVPSSVNVRILAATNRPLERMMEEKRFREDLYYRINVVPFEIPPLRERIEDISLLLNHFVQKVSKKIGKRINGMEEHVRQRFIQYSWPGNIRELENSVEAAVHLSSSEMIQMESLPEYLRNAALYPLGERTLKEILEEAERGVLQNSLEKYHNDKLMMAKVLGISKSTLYEKLNKYGLS
ncbi:sigma-54 interaction domain-containing protein [Falsibacillus albus]|uniref:HTH-type transcriptional regulatory protein TyrR n=1 Tax=Falsibacillus albus TaxID=2478915 RepID=A0A3L7K491_9BACI|nr:sigma 54-interacting transcriptional regulator [Falsibacillus albus]RLQ97873.1 PAS domain-containing protein [Falsibacillus albus]